MQMKTGKILEMENVHKYRHVSVRKNLKVLL